MARAGLGHQLVALLKRNVLLKRRNKKQTITELVLPVYFVVILVGVRFGMKPEELPPVESFPVIPLSFPGNLDLTTKVLYVWPESPAVEQFIQVVLGLMGLPESRAQNAYKMFPDATRADLAYRENTDEVAAGIDLKNTNLNETYYTIRMGYKDIAKTKDSYGSQGDCRQDNGQGWRCQGNTYLDSGFASLQAAIETAFIRLTTGESNFTMSDMISVQQLPKPSFEPENSAFRTMAALYFVMAYSPFISFLAINLVTEKEKKIKEAMRMMGMRDSAFWLAWGLIYVAVIFVVTVMCVLISWATQLYQNSNMFLFFLILFLYGLSIINLAFMLTPLFDKAETAGFLASMATFVSSLLYLPITLTREGYGAEGPESSIPVWGQFLLCLMSPVAFALAIDQSLYLDYTHGGMNFNNMMMGEFPLAYSLTMLAVDFVLYGLLAVYLDKVVPSVYGQRQPPWFCFTPSYWLPHHANSGAVTPDIEADQTEDCEPIAPDLRGKNVVRILNITKVYQDRCSKKQVVAVDGISLEIYEGQITCILGHNGAGKTTLLNMLTGLSPATSGSASIYGLNVTDPNQMEEMRCMTGVCPQHNILFDILTCREHLDFFAALKGVAASSRGTEIQQALEDVGLTDQADVKSENLSGGQKRKLSVAIALIGDPRVIFLDEPTAGMDPYSRRHLWSLLKGRRPGRVILLTTHFMDEADILADRKAFISKGKLKCVGSSLYLKNRFGVGYHLGMEVESYANIAQLTHIVTKDVPTAELSRTHGKEVIYVLPLGAVESFPALFGSLEAVLHDADRAKQLGLKQFGVSMTTLEEVFLKIGVEEEEVEDSEEGDTESNAPLHDSAAGGHSSQINLTVSEKSDPTSLTWRRFWAHVKILFIIQLRRKGALTMRVVIPIVFIVFGMVLQKVIEPPSSSPISDPLTLQPEMYCKTADSSTAENPDFVYFLGSPGGSIDSTDYITQLGAQDLSLLLLNGSVDQLINTTTHMGHYINEVTAELQTIHSDIRVLYNDTAIHSMPIAINVLNNALISMATGITQNITGVSEPWPNLSGNMEWSGGVFASIMMLGFGVAYLPAGLALDVVFNRQHKIRSQLRISGMTLNVYWGSLFFTHIVQYSIVSLCSIIVLLAFQVDAFLYSGAIVSLFLIYIFYMPVSLLLAYVVSFGFSKYETAQGIMMNVLGQFGFWPYMCVSMMDMMGVPDGASTAHVIFVFLFPPYAIFGGLYYISRLHLVESILQGSDPSIPFSKYFEWESYIPVTWFVPIFHAVGMYFLLRIVEVKSTGGDIKDVFGCGSGLGSKGHVPEVNEDLPANEDEDIVEERRRVENWDTANPGKTPVVMVKNLRKEFTKDGARKGCSKKTEDKVKVAVRNNSFAVEAGEVFGLLGPNGAGKTTALNLIIAEEGPTKGRVYIAGYDVRSSLSDAFQAMSYCPQHDALWDAVTVRQHIHCYATIKGIPEENVADVANYYMKSLKILEHADKVGLNLSGGTKRKLSYIISMLGEPQVVLLDEPSTGMDPKSKRFLWDTISAAFDNDERGAILTTHYMEEADALCSRVGIMVNGQLECLGTTQHLKSKYGTGYMLEIKLAQSGAEAVAAGKGMDDLNTAVTSHFPGAVVSECFGDRASYKVPQESINSLSHTFHILEQGKTSLGIEEYSFSQSTLEQVFLLFAKQQLEEGAQGDPEQEEALNRTRSLLRSPSDSPSHHVNVPEAASNHGNAKPAEAVNSESRSEWL